MPCLHFIFFMVSDLYFLLKLKADKSILVKLAIQGAGDKINLFKMSPNSKCTNQN